MIHIVVFKHIFFSLVIVKHTFMAFDISVLHMVN